MNAVESKRGRTALHYATVKGHRETILALVRAGSDTSIKDAKGKTPVELAARHGLEGLLDISKLPTGILFLIIREEGEMRRDDERERGR